MKGQERLRYLAAGGWAWVAFAVVAVLLRGVRWEENYEFAQVLLGWIPYPEYFPIYQHAHNSLSLQAYLTALLMQIEPAPWFACGVRNALYLIAKTLPVYLLAAAVTRRVAWGHVAAILGLIVGNEFATCYPSRPWPMFAGNGAIGTGFALLALACFAWGWSGRAYCLTLLMPAVHVGQFPALAAVAVAHAVSLAKRRDCVEVKRATIGAAVGLAGVAATFVVFLLTRVPYAPVDAGPMGTAGLQAIWRCYIGHFPSHRNLTWNRDQVVLAWSFLQALLVLRLCRRGPWFWMAVYSVAVCVIVWGTMLIHWRLGAETPYILLAWMPYRLENHLIPLSLVMMLGALTGPVRGTSVLVLAAIGLAAAQAGLESAYVFLAGASIVAGALASMRCPVFARVWLIAAAALWVALVREFGLSIEYLAAAMILSAVMPYAHSRLPHYDRWLQHVPSLAAAAGALALALALYTEWRARENPPERLEPTAFECEAIAFMADRGDEKALVLAPPYQWRLQARLGHPITADYATLTWLPYHLELGPTLHQMFRDLFGVDLLVPMKAADPVGAWVPVWTARSRGEWRALAEKYDFKYVVSWTWYPVDLPLAVAGDPLTLYYVE